MKILRQMNSTFKLFLISYLIFALLMFCTYIPIYRYVHGIVSDNVRTQVQRMLNNGVEKLDVTATAVLNAYLSTAKDSRFRPLKYLNFQSSVAPSDVSGLVNALKYPILSQELVVDAGILCRSSLVITRNRAFFSDTYYSFYPDFFSCEDYPFDQWMEIAESGGLSGRWLPEMEYTSGDLPDAYRGIGYCRVWFSAAGYPSSHFYATLNSDRLVEQLVDAQILVDGYIRITNPDGMVMLSRGNVNSRVDCEIISAYSVQTGMSMEIALPITYVQQQLMTLERMILLYGALLVLIAVLLVILFSHRSARPMIRLLNYMEEKKLLDSGEECVHEEPSEEKFHKTLERDYAYIASGVNQLNIQLKSKAEMIREQQEKFAEYLFQQALTHTLYLEQDKLDFERLFPNFPQPCYLAMLKCEEDMPSVEEAARLRSFLLRAAQQHIPDLYYEQMLHNDTLILVLRQWKKQDMEALAERLNRAEIGSRIRVSRICASPAELSDAFVQVQYIDLTLTDDSVICCEEMDLDQSGHTSLPMTFAALQQMYEALSSGNDHLACVILDSCTNVLLEQPDQVMLARHTQSLIAHMLVNIKLEYPNLLFSVVIPSFDAKNTKQLFRKDLPECFRSICALLQERNGKQDLSRRVLSFIEDNLFSAEMCVTMVTEHFGIAKATLQKLIKSATGNTFLAYIASQRLERAYQLLHMPGASVQKVSENCGFSSPNSFYKAFRRKYGIAPSAVTGNPEDKIAEAEFLD